MAMMACMTLSDTTPLLPPPPSSSSARRLVEKSVPPSALQTLSSDPSVFHTSFSEEGPHTTSLPLSQLLCSPPSPPLWLALQDVHLQQLQPLLSHYQLPFPPRSGVSGTCHHPPLLAFLSIPRVSNSASSAHILLIAHRHDVLITCSSAVHLLFPLSQRSIHDALHAVLARACAALLTASRANLDALDVLEARSALLSTDPTIVAHSVWRIRRTAASLRRIYSATLSVVDAAEQPSQLSPARIHLHQCADTLASVREGAHTLLEVLLAVQNNRMQETMQTLAVVTTMFVPLTFLAGIEGMNFSYQPELRGKWSYAAFWIVVLVLVVLQLLYFKKKRWI